MCQMEYVIVICAVRMLWFMVAFLETRCHVAKPLLCQLLIYVILLEFILWENENKRSQIG